MFHHIFPDRVPGTRGPQLGDKGISLVELLTVIVIIGVISTALFSMGNNMNMRVERITVQTLLDEQAVLAHDAIAQSAAQAGYVSADSQSGDYPNDSSKPCTIQSRSVLW